MGHPRPVQLQWISRWSLVLVSAVVLMACGGEAPPPPLVAGPGGTLPREVKVMFFGDEQPCGSGEDCATGQCLFGRCAGLTRTDEPWRTELVADRLHALIRHDPALVAMVSGELDALVRDAELSIPVRARMLLALERVAGGEGLKRLDAHFDSLHESLQGLLAASLLAHGESRHVDRVLADTENERPGTRTEAIRALGGCSTCDLAVRDRVLARLLALATGDVEHVEARAASDAIIRLGDRRAVPVLVDLLEGGPEALRDPISVGLQTLTNAAHGRDVAAWRAWIKAAALAPAPDFTPVARRAEEDIGLPEP